MKILWKPSGKMERKDIVICELTAQSGDMTEKIVSPKGVVISKHSFGMWSLKRMKFQVLFLEFNLLTFKDRRMDGNIL